VSRNEVHDCTVTLLRKRLRISVHHVSSRRLAAQLPVPSGFTPNNSTQYNNFDKHILFESYAMHDPQSSELLVRFLCTTIIRQGFRLGIHTGPSRQEGIWYKLPGAWQSGRGAICTERSLAVWKGAHLYGKESGSPKGGPSVRKGASPSGRGPIRPERGPEHESIA